MNFSHLFILSAPRSGSTLLRVNLNKIPSVISPPETYFIEFYKKNKTLNPTIASDREKICEKWLSFRNHLNDRNLYNRNFFKELVNSGAKSWQDVFHILINLYAKDAGKVLEEGAIICEKTPVHIEFQSEIYELFPDAKIIYLIRDPRDVVASLKTCPWATSSILSNARYWVKTSQLIKGDKSSILLKYEDLVDDPDAAFSKICSLLEVEVEVTSLSSTAFNEMRESTDPKNVDSFKPIDKSYKDKWKTILSTPDKELEKIETICYDQMLQFGYQPITMYNKKLSAVVNLQLWSEKQFRRLYRRVI